MDEEIKTQEPIADTETAKASEPIEEKTPIEETSKQSFTQEQVNEIVRQRLDRHTNKFYNRYGVKDREELDALVGKANSYDVMKERFDGLETTNKQLTEKLTFMENNINPERYDDVRAYFKGKELDFTAENLVNELATHNEWLNVVKEENSPTTTLKSLGTDRTVKNKIETDEEKMRRIFGD